MEVLKEEIYRVTQSSMFKPEFTRLIFAGRCAYEGRTVREFGIVDRSTVHIVLRLRGA